MTKHTPPPWIVRTQVRVGPYRGGYYLARNDTESATAWAKDEANAAFIVKAVNNHDAIHVALLEIEQISDCCVNAEHYTAENALRDLQEIRSIIKRTELSR